MVIKLAADAVRSERRADDLLMLCICPCYDYWAPVSCWTAVLSTAASVWRLPTGDEQPYYPPCRRSGLQHLTTRFLFYTQHLCRPIWLLRSG